MSLCYRNTSVKFGGTAELRATHTMEVLATGLLNAASYHRSVMDKKNILQLGQDAVASRYCKSLQRQSERAFPTSLIDNRDRGQYTVTDTSYDEVIQLTR